ncbi:uncharacterized protein [Nicotiana sylvestris]|uniref:uncharacterized protein n=1 Tax=Nicotiana sylvestris TaxID=4096 RepID=UPI00388CD6B0
MCFMSLSNNEESEELGLMSDNIDEEDDSRRPRSPLDEGTSEEHRKKNRTGKWYLDSACSRYMTGDKQLFKSVTKLDGGTVTFGDKCKGNVIGVGKVLLSSICNVDEVYLVDELGYNLLSISQLCDNDYEVRFKKHGWFTEDESGNIILSGNRDRNVYTIKNLDNFGDLICLTSIIEDPWFSVRRFNVRRVTTSLPSRVIIDESLKAERLKTSAMIKESPIISLHQYLLNRMVWCLIRPILKKTPYELWNGKKSNISYFHPFGCKCFVHNNGKDNLGKFDPKSDEGIFLRYSPSSRAYRVYNKRTLCIEESIHVIFIDTNPRPRNEHVPEDEEISCAPKSVIIGKDHQGIDYDETFAPVARLESIRILLAFAAHKGFKLYQMDTKSTFLNGYISEEVFVKQPPGFANATFPNHVYKLTKVLYDLKQAPRACPNDVLCEEFALSMKGEFEMSMMGELTFFLGLQIKQFPKEIFISQTKYTKELIKKFGMENAKVIGTPIQLLC